MKNESTPAEKIKVSQPNKIIEKSRLNKFQFRERELNSFSEIVFLANGSEKKQIIFTEKSFENRRLKTAD